MANSVVSLSDVLGLIRKNLEALLPPRGQIAIRLESNEERNTWVTLRLPDGTQHYRLLDKDLIPPDNEEALDLPSVNRGNYRKSSRADQDAASRQHRLDFNHPSATLCPGHAHRTLKTTPKINVSVKYGRRIQSLQPLPKSGLFFANRYR